MLNVLNLNHSQGQCTAEQLKKWMPLIKEYKITGTYAQTEMGHGKFLALLWIV